MKSVNKYYKSIIFLSISIFIVPIFIAAQNVQTPQDKATISNFENQAKEYSKLRDKVAGQIPKLSSKSTAEEIEAHKLAFQKGVQSARNGAKQGDIFTPTATILIKKIIKNEFPGKERTELREKIFEAEAKGIPVKINFPYPDSKEQIDMPPTLLLNLPQLPKQLRYRFVGTNFLIIDRENGLIIDYITNALP